MEGRRIPPPPPPRPFVPNAQTGGEGANRPQPTQNIGAQPAQPVPNVQNGYNNPSSFVQNQPAQINQNVQNFQNAQGYQNVQTGQENQISQNAQTAPKDRTKLWNILSAVASALCFGAGLAFLILMFI